MSSKRMTIVEAVDLYGVNFTAMASLRSRTEYRIHSLVRNARGCVVGVRASRYRISGDKPMSTRVLKMFQRFDITKTK